MRNGYVLEQVDSPLIVQTNLRHDELKEIARGCITGVRENTMESVCKGRSAASEAAIVMFTECC